MIQQRFVYRVDCCQLVDLIVAHESVDGLHTMVCIGVVGVWAHC